jgi:glucose/arabinose dehydrogenase
MGLAEGPDGSLYITDDAGGRIWRVLHARRRP